MKKYLILSVMFALAGLLGAQSSAVMDGIVGSSSINSSQAAYLVLVASGQLAEDATPEQGYRLLVEQGWAPWLSTPETRITEADYAWMLAKAWRVPGGLLYSLFPGTRYAFREFQFRGYISSGRDPGSPVSGNEAIRVLGKVMDANTTNSGADQ